MTGGRGARRGCEEGRGGVPLTVHGTGDQTRPLPERAPKNLLSALGFPQLISIDIEVSISTIKKMPLHISGFICNLN